MTQKLDLSWYFGLVVIIEYCLAVCQVFDCHILLFPKTSTWWYRRKCLFATNSLLSGFKYKLKKRIKSWIFNLNLNSTHNTVQTLQTNLNFWTNSNLNFYKCYCLSALTQFLPCYLFLQRTGYVCCITTGTNVAFTVSLRRKQSIKCISIYCLGLYSYN